jgi:hypothetical protein
MSPKVHSEGLWYATSKGEDGSAWGAVFKGLGLRLFDCPSVAGPSHTSHRIVPLLAKVPLSQLCENAASPQDACR